MKRADVVAEFIEWQTRPLCCVYAVVVFDAVRVRIDRHGAMRDETIHFALAVDEGGGRELLGLWVESTVPARFWRDVFNQLKNRGVEHMRIVAANRPDEVRRATDASFPASAVQASLVELIRDTLREARPRDHSLLADALRPIYSAAHARAAQAALDALVASRSGAKYESAVKHWQISRDPLISHFALRREFRGHMLRATETLQALHERLRASLRHACVAADELTAIALVWRLMSGTSHSRRWLDAHGGN